MGFSEIWTLYDSKIFDEKERAALERFLAVSVVCCNENRVSEIERSFYILYIKLTLIKKYFILFPSSPLERTL